MREKNESGLITLEASIVLPIFVFLMLFVYGILIMFMGQQMITHSVFQTAESLSLDSYASEIAGTAGSDGENLVIKLYGLFWSTGADRTYFTSTDKWYESGSTSISETIRKRFLGYLGGNETDADAALKMIGVKDGTAGISFDESAVEDGVLTIKLKYKQEFLFNFQGLAAFDRVITVKVDMWGL